VTADLFDPVLPATEHVAPGALLLRGFALPEAEGLLAAVAAVVERAPLRHMMTAGGSPMSVAMTNCGTHGWVSDRKGYRYSTLDPLSGTRWPPMPGIMAGLAARAAIAAGFAGFAPDACLINRYVPGSRMSLHQDRDEADFDQPIVSVSLGLPATFLFGGRSRCGEVRRLRLDHGDVIVWGGPSRFNYHGVARVVAAAPSATGTARINLTLRRAL
jgi:DNA oxidative demethylase